MKSKNEKAINSHHAEIRELHEIIRVCYENMYRRGISENAIIMKQIRAKVAIPEMQETPIDWQPTEANKEKWIGMLDYKMTQL